MIIHNNLIKNSINSYSKYINSNNNYYIGESNINIINNYSIINIIIPIYIKLIYKVSKINSIYNNNIYMYWNNRYIILRNINNRSNNNVYNIYNSICNINSNNNNINTKNSNIYNNSNYSNKMIYINYIIWYINSIISINSNYSKIIICIKYIYNPIFKIDIFSNYMYSMHNSYTIENIYNKIYEVISNICNNNVFTFGIKRFIITHKGRWNSTKNTISSSDIKYLNSFIINNDSNSNLIKNSIISKNEYGTNSFNIKLYYCNNIVFDKEYIF